MNNFCRVVVSLNVNHTVDSVDPDDGTQEAPEMKSRPNFEVDIIKPDGKTLSFSCSYIADQEQGGGQQEEGFGKIAIVLDLAFRITGATSFSRPLLSRLSLSRASSFQTCKFSRLHLISTVFDYTEK